MPLRRDTLEKYLEMIKLILIEVAKGKRKDRVITYKDLEKEMGGPGRGYIGEVLEEVSDREHGQNRPLLSALVVRKDTKRPSYGFWELRVLPPSLRNASKQEKIDRWKQEHRKTCEYWKSHDP